jgi:hypothetical protein
MSQIQTPNRAELPTSAQLVRSTIIAIVAALVILVTIVNPYTYGIDPFGMGRILGLTEANASVQPTAATATNRSDELQVALKPGEGAEYKMTMAKGAQARFSWTVAGGAVTFDMHGTPWHRIETSYKKGDGAATDTGTLSAAFDGTHGWFWRNRGTEPVTITLKVEGAYSDLKKK